MACVKGVKSTKTQPASLSGSWIPKTTPRTTAQVSRLRKSIPVDRAGVVVAMVHTLGIQAAGALGVEGATLADEVAPSLLQQLGGPGALVPRAALLRGPARALAPSSAGWCPASVALPPLAGRRGAWVHFMTALRPRLRPEADLPILRHVRQHHRLRSPARVGISRTSFPETRLPGPCPRRGCLRGVVSQRRQLRGQRQGLSSPRSSG